MKNNKYKRMEICHIVLYFMLHFHENECKGIYFLNTNKQLMFSFQKDFIMKLQKV